jgi:hypothetical protein
LLFPTFYCETISWAGLVARRWLRLTWHMFKLSAKQHDRYTAQFEFVYYTVMTIGMLVMKTLRSRTCRLRRALGC